MSKQDTTVKLHTLNNLLSLVANTDSHVASHVRSAINFTLENATPGGPDEDELLANAEQLLKIHRSSQDNELPFYHCDFRKESYDPLWLQAHFKNALRELSGYPRALLLVTGLRRMICPPTQRWTQRRQMQYDNAIHYMEEVSAEYTSTKTHLYLLFL